MVGSRIKLSLIVAALALVLVIVSYIFVLWSSDRQKANDLPVEAVSMMMRDLLKYHEKRGGFPEDLKKLEGVIWEKKERNFSIENRAFTHKNYYYFYTQISHHQFTLWAIPIGKSREEAPTWFLVTTPEKCRRWKGAALPLDQIDKLKTNPTIGEIGVLGLIEQPLIDLRAKQATANGFATNR
jgi:hypothetical protein